MAIEQLVDIRHRREVTDPTPVIDKRLRLVIDVPEERRIVTELILHHPLMLRTSYLRLKSLHLVVNGHRLLFLFGIAFVQQLLFCQV